MSGIVLWNLWGTELGKYETFIENYGKYGELLFANAFSIGFFQATTGKHRLIGDSLAQLFNLELKVKEKGLLGKTEGA